MDQARKTAQIFKILSVETRIHMVELLKTRSLCVNALAKNLGITPAAVSQHLRILREADVVIPEKRGYFVHYRIDEKTLRLWSERVENLLRPSPRKDMDSFLQENCTSEVIPPERSEATKE